MKQPRLTSNQEFFDAISGLIGELGEGHQGHAASLLEQGLRCVNGLTDGWALLLEFMQKVEAEHGAELEPGQRETLRTLRVVAESLVYRR